jgi:signal transduction histidine kinase
MQLPGACKGTGIKDMRGIRFGIVYRMTLVFSLLVLATALMMYKGVELRRERVRDAQKREAVRFLVRSLSLGIQNYVASGDAALIGETVFEALNKNVSPEITVTGCDVKTRDGQKIFSYRDPLADKGRKESAVSAGITVKNKETGGKSVIGRMTLRYASRDPQEIEIMRQVITIGNTIGAMFEVFYRNKHLFQARELVQTVEQDPNIMYCVISGVKNETHFSYKRRNFNMEKLVTASHGKRALSVNHAAPLEIQNIAKTAEHGEIIEASMLIEESAEKIGVVRIGYSLKAWTRKIEDTRRRVTLIIIGATLLAMALSYYFSRGVSGPITRLSKVARSAAEETPRRKIDLADAEKDMARIMESFESVASKLQQRRDEVGDMAASFSRMLSSLQHRIRELKQFYQKMSQTDRLFAMGRLSAGIAHEINNPLAIISTYVQIIEKRKDIDDELRGELKIISEEITRIAGKVGELLTFAQDAPVKMREADIHDLIRRTAALMNHQFKKKNIEVVEDFRDTDPLLVPVDENRIKQVILNLLLNALQAMDSGGRITFRTFCGEDTVSFAVRDTGPGIPDDDLPHIFDPFFTRRRTGDGTGLGLAISHSIVKAHNGDIEAISQMGEGTEFVVTLPREAASSE